MWLPVSGDIVVTHRERVVWRERKHLCFFSIISSELSDSNAPDCWIVRACVPQLLSIITLCAAMLEKATIFLLAQSLSHSSGEPTEHQQSPIRWMARLWRSNIFPKVYQSLPNFTFAVGWHNEDLECAVCRVWGSVPPQLWVLFGIHVLDKQQCIFAPNLRPSSFCIP